MNLLFISIIMYAIMYGMIAALNVFLVFDVNVQVAKCVPKVCRLLNLISVVDISNYDLVFQCSLMIDKNWVC